MPAGLPLCPSCNSKQIVKLARSLRQQVSRLVRKTLSFSKKTENQIEAIWYFIHHYNASLPV